VFCASQGNLVAVRDKINEFKVGAPARAGVLAPLSVTIPAGPTGMDPSQTSFFQTLNIATKINKGSIEILNDVEVVVAGTKVCALFRRTTCIPTRAFHWLLPSGRSLPALWSVNGNAVALYQDGGGANPLLGHQRRVLADAPRASCDVLLSPASLLLPPA
jgi:hypothetical protein